MNENLKHALEPEEELLWAGTPEPFTAKDKTHQKGFITRMLISLAVGLFCTVGYCLVAKAGTLKPGVFVVLWVICIYAIFTERISCGRVKKLEYGLTSKRVIVLNDGNVNGFEYGSVDSYRFEKDLDGHTCLLVGKDAEKLSMYRWRMLPVEPFNKDADTGKVEKAGLYAISTPDTFRKIFSDRVKK